MLSEGKVKEIYDRTLDMYAVALKNNGAYVLLFGEIWANGRILGYDAYRISSDIANAARGGDNDNSNSAGS